MATTTMNVEDFLDAYRSTLSIKDIAADKEVSEDDAYRAVSAAFDELNADAVLDAFTKSASTEKAARKLKMNAGEVGDLLDVYLYFLYTESGDLKRNRYTELRDVRIIELWNSGDFTNEQISERFNIVKTRVFGVINDARKVDPDKVRSAQGKRPPNEELVQRNDKIVALREAGYAVRDIADEMDVAENVVANVLSRRDVVIFPRGKDLEERNEKIIELRKSGLTIKEIAAEVDVPSTTISNVLYSNDVVLHPRGKDLEERNEKIIELRKSGLTIKEIAAEVDVPSTTISNVVYGSGVVLYPEKRKHSSRKTESDSKKESAVSESSAAKTEKDAEKPEKAKSQGRKMRTRRRNGSSSAV